MESLQKISENLLAKIKTGGEITVKEPPRPYPLSENDALKIDKALNSISEVRDVYGSVPVRDTNGDIYRWEHAPIGKERKFTGEASEALRKAILTPASKETIVHHVMKLAAMVRDTRGEEALTVVAYEIARECHDISEWAVIEACRDYWKTGAVWYPTAGELLKQIIAKHQSLKAALSPKDQLALPSNGFYEQAKTRIGEAKARAWFADSYLEGKTLYAASKFKKDWIVTNFMPDFRDIFDSVEVKRGK